MQVRIFIEQKNKCEAKEAFTSQNGHVYKVRIPQEDQVDYFFDIPENSKNAATKELCLR